MDTFALGFFCGGFVMVVWRLIYDLREDARREHAERNMTWLSVSASPAAERAHQAQKLAAEGS